MSAEKKLRVVVEGSQSGATISEVCRRHQVHRAQLPFSALPYSHLCSSVAEICFNIEVLSGSYSSEQALNSPVSPLTPTADS